MVSYRELNVTGINREWNEGLLQFFPFARHSVRIKLLKTSRERSAGSRQWGQDVSRSSSRTLCIKNRCATMQLGVGNTPCSASA